MKIFERKLGAPYHLSPIETIDYSYPTVMVLPALTGHQIKSANYMAKVAQAFIGRTCEMGDNIRFLTTQYDGIETKCCKVDVNVDNPLLKSPLYCIAKAYNAGDKSCLVEPVQKLVSRAFMPMLEEGNIKEKLNNITFFTYSLGSVFMNMIVDELRQQLRDDNIHEDNIDTAISGLKFVNLSPVVDVLSIDKDIKGVSIINRGDKIAVQAGVNNEHYDTSNTKGYAYASFQENKQMCIFTDETVAQGRYDISGKVYFPRREYDPHGLKTFFPSIYGAADKNLNAFIVREALGGCVQSSIDGKNVCKAQDIFDSTENKTFQQSSTFFHPNVKAVPISMIKRSLSL